MHLQDFILFVVTKMEILKNSSNILQSIEPDLVYTKVSGVVSQYILRLGHLWHSLSSSMLKSKQFFSLVISKLISALSLSLSLSGRTTWCSQQSHQLITKLLTELSLTSLLNFGMSAHSTTLISQFFHFISKAGGFG